MRDPMAWSLPLFRAFGIRVRVHLFFFIVTLGLFARTVYDGGYAAPLDVFLFTVVLLFGIILLHEFGHCFGGRSVGGEAEEILIWPLGGLAMVDVPRNWKAHTFTVAAGPFVNVLICFILAVAIAGAGFVPTLNPISEPYACEMHNYRDGRTYTSAYGLRLYEPVVEGAAPSTHAVVIGRGKPEYLNEVAAKSNLERAQAPVGIVWLNRAFWLSWVLLLFNLIPAYPLDGGQLMQGLVWWRSDYRQGVTVACYSGYVCGAIMLIAAIATNETLLSALALAMLLASYVKLKSMEMDESPFGDFSQGYSSLDDEDAPPPRKRPGYFKRWMTARAAKRMQRDLEQRQQEDTRMDQLLEKIARSGKASLTDEERRFMERVSERYRK
jgi:Zn-dependent protease